MIIVRIVATLLRCHKDSIDRSDAKMSTKTEQGRHYWSWDNNKASPIQIRHPHVTWYKASKFAFRSRTILCNLYTDNYIFVYYLIEILRLDRWRPKE